MMSDSGKASASSFKAGGIMQTPRLAKIGVMTSSDRPGIASTVLGALSHSQINVEFIVETADIENRSHLVLCVNEHDLQGALAAIESVRAAILAEKIVFQRHVAMLAVYGPHFRDHPGIARLVFAALAASGINILAISTSISTVACLVEDEAVNEAVEALRKAFDVPESAIFTPGGGLSRRTRAGE